MIKKYILTKNYTLSKNHPMLTHRVENTNKFNMKNTQK